MAGLLLHAGATVECFHKAAATVSAGSQKVKFGGQLAATASSTVTVTPGTCPFKIPVPPPPATKPQPCATITWGTKATKVKIGGQPALLGPALGVVAGVCKSADQIPQGAPTLSAIQSKVSGK